MRRIREHSDRDDMEIVSDNGDHIICKIPKKWVKINPSRILSEEEMDQIRQNLSKGRRFTGDKTD